MFAEWKFLSNLLLASDSCEVVQLVAVVGISFFTFMKKIGRRTKELSAPDARMVNRHCKLGERIFRNPPSIAWGTDATEGKG